MTLTSALVATLLILASSSVLACAPAPSCWMKSARAYLRSVCRSYSGQTLQEIAQYVEEPENVTAFGKACKKFGIHFKERR